MKIKALIRPISAHQPPGSDVAKLPKTTAPEAHPFERAREYTRALNAVKLERLFSAPFVCQLGRGHVDGIWKIAADASCVSRLASGSGGVVKVWDLVSRDELWQAKAHDNLVKGLAWADSKILTCSTDSVKLFDPYQARSNAPPLSSWLGNFTGLSKHRSSNTFAASGSNSVHVYDLAVPSAAPTILRFSDSTDTVTNVAFNQVEQSILASTGLDRSVVFYDLRSEMPLKRIILQFASNALSWNPMEAFNFAVASEDHNCYLFDMRRMDRALNILRDHVSAVMDIKFSPTGQELVTGSYDRTIRLWDREKGHSRDIYHSKRQQRVFSVEWTLDNKYVLSGSDDGNIRIWRSNASSREGVVSARQRQSREYNDSLINRYSHMPEIRRIQRHRRVPKVVKTASSIKNEELKAIQRRAENLRKHSKKQFEKRQPEREKVILSRQK